MLGIGILLEFINGLKDVITETDRSEVAHRLADLIADALQETNKSNYRQWVYRDRLKFLQRCNLVDLNNWIPNTLHVATTPLAEFCSKWVSVNTFHLHNSPTTAERPITPPMNALRITMVEELQALDKPQK